MPHQLDDYLRRRSPEQLAAAGVEGRTDDPLDAFLESRGLRSTVRARQSTASMLAAQGGVRHTPPVSFFSELRSNISQIPSRLLTLGRGLARGLAAAGPPGTAPPLDPERRAELVEALGEISEGLRAFGPVSQAVGAKVEDVTGSPLLGTAAEIAASIPGAAATSLAAKGLGIAARMGTRAALKEGLEVVAAKIQKEAAEEAARKAAAAAERRAARKAEEDAATAAGKAAGKAGKAGKPPKPPAGGGTAGTLSREERNRIIGEIMGRFKRGTLKTAQGRKVTSRKQAMAIAMDAVRKAEAAAGGAAGGAAGATLPKGVDAAVQRNFIKQAIEAGAIQSEEHAKTILTNPEAARNFVRRHLAEATDDQLRPLFGDDMVAAIRTGGAKEVPPADKIEGFRQALEESVGKLESAKNALDDVASKMASNPATKDIDPGEKGFLLLASAGKDLRKKAPEESFQRRLVSFLYQAYLSGVATHARNLYGNTENLIANNVARIFQGRPTEAGVALGSIIPSIRHALGAAWYTLKTGEAPLIITTAAEAAIPEGATVIPSSAPVTRALAAADHAFLVMNESAELAAQAFRASGGNLERMQAILKRPNKQIINAVKLAARRGTFTDTNTIVDTLTRLSRVVERLPLGVLGRFLVSPFIRTPVNITLRGFEYTPLGYLNFAKALSKQASRMSGGLVTGGREAFGRATLGSIILGTVGYEAFRGNITGDGPRDPEMRRLLIASHQWQRNSIRIGNRWVSYENLGPITQVMSMTATAVERISELFAHPERYDDAIDFSEQAAIEALGAMTRNLTNNTFFRDMDEMMDILTSEDPNKMAVLAGERLGLVLQPFTILAQTAAEQDPFSRKPRTAFESIKLRFPGARETVPPRFDVLGEPELQAGTPATTDTQVELQVMSPFRVTNPAAAVEQGVNPVLLELVRLGLAPDLASSALMIPAPGGGGQLRADLTSQERLELQRIRRRVALERLPALIQSPQYQRLTDDQKRAVIRAILEASGRAGTAFARGKKLRGEELKLEEFIRRLNHEK